MYNVYISGPTQLHGQFWLLGRIGSCLIWLVIIISSQSLSFSSFRIRVEVQELQEIQGKVLVLFK